jgi:hypothetical protein
VAWCDRYANTWKRHLWYKQQQHYRSKIAVDMSHYRMLERVAASNRSTVILEDDAQLTGEKWLPDLLTTLRELPEVRSSGSFFVGWTWLDQHLPDAAFSLDTFALVPVAKALLVTSSSHICHRSFEWIRSGGWVPCNSIKP